MKRLTISLPDDLDRSVRGAVADGIAPTLSRFFVDAARRHLEALREQRFAGAAGRLDPREETAIARNLAEGDQAPWGRLR